MNKSKVKVRRYVDYRNEIYNSVNLRKKRFMNHLTVKEHKDKQVSRRQSVSRRC